MKGKIFNKKNILPLAAVPSAVWGFDLLMHLAQGALPRLLWLITLSAGMPAVAWAVTGWVYRRRAHSLAEMISPVWTGLAGFVYGQFIYVIAVNLALNMTGIREGMELSNSIRVLKLLPFVPAATLMLSIYDNTYIAVPLAGAAILLAGWRWHRRLSPGS